LRGCIKKRSKERGICGMEIGGWEDGDATGGALCEGCGVERGRELI